MPRRRLILCCEYSHLRPCSHKTERYLALFRFRDQTGYFPDAIRVCIRCSGLLVRVFDFPSLKAASHASANTIVLPLEPLLGQFYIYHPGERRPPPVAAHRTPSLITKDIQRNLPGESIGTAFATLGARRNRVGRPSSRDRSRGWRFRADSFLGVSTVCPSSVIPVINTYTAASLYQ